MGARAGVEATFTVNRSDFGMRYGLEKRTLGDAVRVIVSLEGIRG
jgi:polyisoprenoid-binding protein YceI